MDRWFIEQVRVFSSVDSCCDIFDISLLKARFGLHTRGRSSCRADAFEQEPF